MDRGIDGLFTGPEFQCFNRTDRCAVLGCPHSASACRKPPVCVCLRVFMCVLTPTYVEIDDH